MEQILENVVIYGGTFLLCGIVIYLYIRKQRRNSVIVRSKIEKAKLEGLFEPVSLHPVIDVNSCIRTGACVAACPEKDIIGIVNGKATTVNASQCIGHGACFHACPTQAITLCIGTEKRGVDLPHVTQTFETNVPGIYIAGELGGMGLIKNAVEQGRQAVDNIAKVMNPDHKAEFDLIVVGAGPAGISATLTARKNRLRCLTLEQDTLGGTVYTFPRSKIVMTSAMDLPLYGKVKLFETSKTELLNLWHAALSKNQIEIRENARVEEIVRKEDFFEVRIHNGESHSCRCILLATGRRGTPRKLDVPGEIQEKVAYRLLEPEEISGKEIMIVGGGDSAIESALLLADRNHVVLSYRGEAFNRIKPKNGERISQAASSGKVEIRLNTNVTDIGKTEITLKNSITGEQYTINNDLVFIFAGGELPTQFLMRAGIQITKKFGDAILKH